MKNVFKAGKSFLKQTARNRNLFFTITVLLLLFVSLHGQWSQLYATDKTEAPQKETAYPATPEGVVEAEHRRQYEYNFPSEPYYFLEEEKCEADCGITVKSFAVKKLSLSKDKARVMVEFEVVGTFCPGYIGEKEDNGNTLTKTKSGEYHGFDIFKRTGSKFDKGVIFYDLVRKDGKWMIVPKRKGCPVTYMSINATIKFIEDNIKLIKDESIKKRNLKIIDLLKGLQKTDK
jgi:hypothetical protein